MPVEFYFFLIVLCTVAGYFLGLRDGKAIAQSVVNTLSQIGKRT